MARVSAPTCNHIKTNGEFCESPALRNDRYCYFHRAQRERTKAHARAARQQQPLEIPLLEDEESVHLAIGDVLNAILQKRLDTKTAGLLLYGLQTALQSVRHCRFKVYEYDHRVTNYTEYEQVTLQQEIDEEVRLEERRISRKKRRAETQVASKIASEITANSEESAEISEEALPTSAPAGHSDAQLEPQRPADPPQEAPATPQSDELFWSVVGTRAAHNAATLTRELKATLRAAEIAQENLAEAKKKPQSVKAEPEEESTTA